MSVEQPEYTLLEKEGAFELRQYKPMIIAETFVDGSLSEASSAGFRRVAGYIFGGNVSQKGMVPEKIAMTAPVIVEKQPGKMPPGTENSAQRWRLNFVMPAGLPLDSLPVPNDSRVSLREIAGHKTAVMVFTGFADEVKVEQKIRSLLNWIAAHGLLAVTAPQLARYNPPWTLPFLRRNEILINIS